MSADTLISILICKDAGGAGRMLLGRQDLRVRWALTEREAEAVIHSTKCGVCITREPLARAVLAACAASQRTVTTIVLLDAANWSSWREYYEAGATSVVQAGATEQLLDAMSDATGLSFRSSPRVPYRTDVRFALGEEGGAWTSVNLSATGICLLEFPPYALGCEVDLAFELAGKRYEFNAIVAQMLRIGSHRAVGLAFRDLSRELQTTLDEIIRAEQRRTRTYEDPVEDFDALDETTMLALRTSTAHGDALASMRALISGGTVPHSETTARWLHAACDALSTYEVAAIRSPQTAPPWAQDVLHARLRVYQARARAGTNAPSENDVREIFGLCQRLAETAAGTDHQVLVQVTNLRAEILRALYDPNLLDN